MLYFFKINPRWPFRQSITNDDVLANNIHTIRHQLRAYVTPSTHFVQEKFGKSSVVCTIFSGSPLQATYGHQLVQASYSQINQFFNSGQTGWAGFNELLKCKEFSFQYNGLLYCRARVSSVAYTECTSDQSPVVVKRSSGCKRYYPPQFKHSPRIAAARVLKTTLPERTTLAVRE